MIPVKLGIIGLGHIGKFHVRAIRQLPDLDIIAVCDRNHKYETIAPEGVDFHIDYKKMLKDEQVKTAVVATPNASHYSIAKDALLAGKNVILEKPAAESLEEIEELENLAASNGLSIYYAFHAASAFDVNWFENYYREPENRSELGPVTGFFSRFYDPYIQNGELTAGAEGLQNCWFDSGINAISVIQRFINIDSFRVENVSAAVNNHSKPGFVQCHAEFSFSIAGEDQTGMGAIDTNWTSGRNHKSTILNFGQTRNLVRMDHSSQKVFRRYPGGRETELADLSEGNERLFNHYLGVFKDYLDHHKAGSMNNTASLKAHNLLFETQGLINAGLDN